MSFLKKVIAAGQNIAANAAAGGGLSGGGGPSSNQGQQQGSPPSQNSGGGGGAYSYQHHSHGGPSPMTSPTSGGGGGGAGFGIGALGMGGLKTLVPQGIQNAVQTRKVAGQVSTLLLRIQTSTLGRDRREAISDLCDINPPEVAEHIRPEDLSMLLMIADMNNSDQQLMTKVFELISSITEERVVPDGIRDGILQCLLDNHVSSFLDALTLPSSPSGISSSTASGFGNDANDAEGEASGGGGGGAAVSMSALRQQTFWVRYHSVKVLQRLQEFDTISLQKQLLSSNSIGSIIDILQDGTNDGALRSEGMILLEHITMADMELQTILAFDSCFEKLFEIVHAEGGVSGDVTAVDCLRIIHNMLRNNKATQKFFREMGLVKSLRPLLVDATYASSSHSDGAVGSPDGRVSQKGLEVILSALDIVQCILRFGDGNGEGLSARDSIAQAGLVEGLCRVAFSSKLDDRTTIASLRALALLAVSHKPTGEQLLNTKLNVKDASNVPALWACLHTALYHEDLTHQAAALQIIGASMQTAATGAQIASFLVKGLAPPAGGSAAVHIASQQSSKEGGLQCGQLLAACLMTVSPPTPNSRYYAAWVLNQSLLVPQITEQMLFLPWGAPKHTFFLAYVRQLEEIIKTRHCNLATVAMLIRPLFTWFAFCGKGIYMFLGWTGSSVGGGGSASTVTSPRGTGPNSGGQPQPTHSNSANNGGANTNSNSTNTTPYQGLSSFNFFLEWSSNTRDPVHLRFLCAMVCVAAAVACPSQDLPSTILTNKTDLIQRFCAAVRLGMLEELLYNVSSSPEWSDPPTNILHARSNALILYDKDYVAILGELSGTARRWLQMAPPPQHPTHAQQHAAAGMHVAGYPPSSSPSSSPAAAVLAGHGMAPQHQGLPQMAQGQMSSGTQPTAQQHQQQQMQQMQMAAAQQQQQQQQLQQYEHIIRQLQSELKTRDDEIKRLTVTNEELQLQNEELSTSRDRGVEGAGGVGGSVAGGQQHQRPTVAASEQQYHKLLVAKDEEIKRLRETLERLSANNPIGNTTAPLMTNEDIQALKQQVEDSLKKLEILESERDELLILVAELDEENETLKQLSSSRARGDGNESDVLNVTAITVTKDETEGAPKQPSPAREEKGSSAPLQRPATTLDVDTRHNISSSAPATQQQAVSTPPKSILKSQSSTSKPIEAADRDGRSNTAVTTASNNTLSDAVTNEDPFGLEAQSTHLVAQVPHSNGVNAAHNTNNNTTGTTTPPSAIFAATVKAVGFGGHAAPAPFVVAQPVPFSSVPNQVNKPQTAAPSIPQPPQQPFFTPLPHHPHSHPHLHPAVPLTAGPSPPNTNADHIGRSPFGLGANNVSQHHDHTFTTKSVVFIDDSPDLR